MKQAGYMLGDLQQSTLPLWASGDSSTKGGAGMAHRPDFFRSANWEKDENRAPVKGRALTMSQARERAS